MNVWHEEIVAVSFLGVRTPNTNSEPPGYIQKDRIESVQKVFHFLPEVNNPAF